VKYSHLFSSEDKSRFCSPM